VKKKILIVEDDLPLVKILTDHFVEAGFDIITAGDGQEGLVKALAEQPDLILLDIVMPNMDGMTMLKQLRERPEGRDIPVTILTNLSDMDITAEALESGVYDYLVKTNWTPDELVKRVQSKLQLRG
jgi:two-component system alkaline phosphatase synthesis response regulator PhoP